MLNHGITHNVARRDEPRQRHRRLRRGIRVSRAAQLAHVAPVIEGMAAQGLEADRRRGAARALREDAVALVRAAGGNRPTRRAREVGEEKFRVWRIYLAGSAHAFDRGWLSLWQLLAGKPLPDGRLPHPLTREYMYPRDGASAHGSRGCARRGRPIWRDGHHDDRQPR